MDELSFQQVFSRVYGYLTEADVEMTSERCRQMLQLIDDAMEEIGEMGEEPGRTVPGKSVSGHRLLANVMDRLPDYFVIPEVSTPTVRPPLCRGSIGYHRDE